MFFSTLVPELEGLIARAEKALTYLLEDDKKTVLAAAKTVIPFSTSISLPSIFILIISDILGSPFH